MNHQKEQMSDSETPLFWSVIVETKWATKKKLHIVTTASCLMVIRVMGSTNCWYNTGYENLNTPSRQGLLSPLHEPIKAASNSTLLLFSTHGTYIAGWCSTPNQLLIFPKCLSFADLFITKHSPDMQVLINIYNIFKRQICLNIHAVCLYEEPKVQGGYLFFIGTLNPNYQ